jgi:hypothetical protein
MFISCVNDNKIITGVINTAEQLSPVTATTLLNITMIAGDDDTCDKFFAGFNDTGEQLSPVSTTPTIRQLA